MPYIQPTPLRMLPGEHLRERLNRRVLIAVELFDPVAQSLVSRNVIIRVRGIDGDPIVSWSGRFVWLEQGDKWPTEISIEPVNLPFTKQIVQPPRPPNFPIATASERLVRIVLQPTPAYPFDGVTAMRGCLTDRLDAGSPPLANVRVQLAWFDLTSASWVPAPPALPVDPTTDQHGDFAAFLRLIPRRPAEPDIVNGFVRVRLQLTTTGAPPEMRATPDDHAFLPPERAPRGRVPEGRMLPVDLRLGWSELRPI